MPQSLTLIFVLQRNVSEILDETINNLTTTKGSTGSHSSEVVASVPGETTCF